MIRIKPGFILAVIVMLLLAAPGGGQASQPEQDPPPISELDLETLRERRLSQLAGEQPPLVSPSGAADPNLEAAQAPSRLLSAQGIESWTKIVYQAWVDENHEIFIANSDGSNPQRLTYHNASDVLPTLTRGGTRIAFASNRDGDFEIYTMNPDGSDVQQITFNSSWDSLPAWSPDGSKLAYVAPRGGYYQIFVINADGSGWTQLTYSALDSIDPSWSPDGTQIAFTTWDEGGYGHVWVMPSWGGAATALTDPSNQFLPGDTSWSPNGEVIAWDTVNRSTGFVDSISVVSPVYQWLSGVTVQKRVHYEDHLVGSWSPDNTQLIFNRIQYTRVDNRFYITSASIETVCGLGASVYCARPDSQLPAPMFSFYPEWQSLDTQAPLTHFEPLARYSRAHGFMLGWSRDASGPAPISRYEVQFRAGENDWWGVHLPQQHQNSAWLLSGASGDTVRVRVRGLDEAGNQETWESNPGGSGSTQLFTNLVEGYVGDPRGFGLANATLVFGAALDRTPAVGANGRYLAHTTSEGYYTVSASAPGFGALQDTRQALMGDRWQDFYFPPANNLIQNGAFEQGSLNGWTAVISATNMTPIETLHIRVAQAAGQYFTGRWGVTLGSECEEPCLSAETYTSGRDGPEEPEASSDYSGNIVVGMDGMDRLYVLSTRLNTLYFNLRQANGTWNAPVVLEQDDRCCSSIRIEVLDSGQAYAVWKGVGGVMRYSRRSASGGWSAPAPLSFSPSESDLSIYDMTVDRQGNLLLLSWWEGNLTVYKMTPQGTWQGRVRVSDWSTSNAASTAVMATGQDGTIHVYWKDEYGVFYGGRRPDGSLMDTIAITDPVEGNYGYRLLALMDGQDRLHLFSDSHHRIRYSNGTWGPLTTLQGTMVIADYSDEMVVASGYGFGQRWTPERGWERLGGEMWPPLVLDSGGGIHMVEMLLTHSMGMRATAAGQASLQQVVTVPANMRHPTLAFASQLRGEPGQQLSHFAVNISMGETTTQVFTSTALHSWEHAWVDLSAWAGQTITVTFSLYQAQGEPLFYLDLDDVSLGAWQTPVIYEVQPGQVEAPAAGVVVQLRGDNFNAGSKVYLNGTQVPAANVTFVDEQHLSFRLPVGFEVGPNDIKIVNPDGHQFTLGNGLQLGRRLYLPLVRR